MQVQNDLDKGTFFYNIHITVLFSLLLTYDFSKKLESTRETTKVMPENLFSGSSVTP